MQRSSLVVVISAVIATTAPEHAAAEEREAEPEPAVVDVAQIRQALRVFHDGKGHYLVLPPLPKQGLDVGPHIYYGDGKVLYRQLRSGGGRQGDTVFYGTLMDPRTFGERSRFELRGDKLTYTCDDRLTSLVPLAPAAAKPLLAAAVFRDVYWRRTPHALARDARGIYYYVDRLAEQFTVGQRHFVGFRVFVGPRGKVKPLRMKNAITDTSGEIFITASGQLRLIVDAAVNAKAPPRASWLVGNRRTELTAVDKDLYKTSVLIFRELGMYTGLKLRRPCDDL